MSKRKNAVDPRTQYKTEDQLKAEAMERMERERLEEQSRKPKPAFEKKIENFWFHYKLHTIGAVVAVVVLGAILLETVFAPKPDLTIVMVTSLYYPDELRDNLILELEEYLADINGDGRIMVQIDYIPFEGYPDDEQQDTDSQEYSDQSYALGMKFVAIVSAGVEQIYILDEANYRYLYSMGGDEVFKDLSAIPGSDGSALSLTNTKLAESPYAEFYDGLSFYQRKMEITDKNRKEVEATELLLENIKS